MFWFDNQFAAVLSNQAKIISLLNQILAKEAKMAIDLTALNAGVAQQTTVNASIIQLLDNVAAQLAAISSGSTDAATQQQIDALVQTLQANNAAISDDVVKNTPAAATLKR